MTRPTVCFLLVDDLEENLLALEGLLRRDGLTLLKARSGTEALELLLVHEVALAILDVQMPGMDGFELAELMRGAERTRRVPIIFVTAGARDEQRRFRGYEAGAVDFLYKPIESHALLSKADVFFELDCRRQETSQLLDEAQRASAELRASEARFRDLADAMPQLVWTALPDGTVDYYNARVESYSGISQEGDHWTWTPVLHPDDMAPTQAAWQHALETGDLYEAQHRVRLADGTYRWHLSRGVPVRDKAGDVVKWYGTATGIQAQKEAEVALRDLNETLETRVKERTAQVRALASELTLAEQRERHGLAQVLHDDLQQALYGVRFKLHLAQVQGGDGDSDDAALQLKAADELVAGAIATTRRLTVDFSPLVLEGGGLDEALRWLVIYMKDRFGLDVHLTVHGPLTVPRDDMRVLLFQAVREALFNVAKYAGTDRATAVLAERDGVLAVDVADEGCGFDAAEFMAGPIDTAGGFGLRNARERLALFGATFDVDSTPGAGTRVQIRIPTEGLR